MILFIDNYDSFTFNLVHLFAKFNKNLVVLRNDDPRILEVINSYQLEGVVISPGPGRPEESGLCLKALERLSPFVPVLGVCLGHQILAVYANIKVLSSKRIMHGKISSIYHNSTSLFFGLSNPFLATRYHSLIIDEPQKDSLIRITARSEFEEPMALEYKDRPWFGLQFHPESILTKEGTKIIKNFIKEVEKRKIHFFSLKPENFLNPF